MTAVAALVLMLPLWPLSGIVVDARPGCAALVQAQDPATGEQAPDGYALVLATSDGYGNEFAPGDQVQIAWPQGNDPTEARPVQVTRNAPDAQAVEVDTVGLGWLDAAAGSDALRTRCSPPEM
jgi:hypothetical protein